MSSALPEDAVDPVLREKIRPVLNRLESLPTLPMVVTKILNLVEDPKSTGQQVAEAVGMDQAMVAAVLKIVNSPFYGLNRRISSVNHAILLLGFRTIRNMALSATLLTTFGNASSNRKFDRALFWRHSIGCACTARLLGKRLRLVDPEEAFLAGLIHDMGRIVFDHYFATEFARVLERTQAGEPLLPVEREVFGVDHATVGRLVAQKWNFPPGVAEAIGAHHEPSRAEKAGSLAAVVHVADELSHRAFSGDETPAMRGPFDPTVMERIGLSAELAASLAPELEAELEKAQVFLDLLQ